MRRLAGRRATTLVATGLTGLLALGACTPSVRPTEERRQSIVLGPEQMQLAAELESFAGCEDILTYLQDSVIEAGAATYMYGGRGGALVDAVGTPVAQPQSRDASESATATAASPAPSAPVAGQDFSATNVQEVGVDEPDIVKTDGKTIVAIAGNELHVVDATGAAPVLRGTLVLDANQGGYGGELFLEGGRVVLLTNGWRNDPGGPRPVPQSGDASATREFIAPQGSQVAILSSIDISDPSQPRLENKVELDGQYVSARLVDGVARVVLRSFPRFEVQSLPGPVDHAGVEKVVTDAVQQTELTDWLPNAHTAAGDVPLVECADVSRPPQFSGVGTTTVVTVDTEQALAIGDSVAVLADAETVYASARSLYVATNKWLDPAALQERAETANAVPFLTTEIHKFDISEPARTTYNASGRVRGHLLDQWSLSEHDGHLRAATTEFPQWFGNRQPEQQSESFMTVLRQDGDALARVGQVGGLGRDEQIYAVRYFGPTAYVVTFRQTDPLYVLDLSDPTAPAVTGELKILGYSAYLHPVGDGLLLGVGQDATEEGRTLGMQLSLFDVSDPANPKRLHQTALAGANSDAEYDHRAFLWWPAEKLTVVPLQVYDFGPVSGREPIDQRGAAPDVAEPDAVSSQSPPAQPFLGAVGFNVDAGGGFGERGRIQHVGRHQANPFPQVTRSLVIGTTLYTLSDVGLLASDITNFAERGWVSF